MIGEHWNPNDWDDEPLTEEEIEETLAIHRRQKDGEQIRRRPRSERVLTPSIPRTLRSVQIH